MLVPLMNATFIPRGTLRARRLTTRKHPGSRPDAGATSNRPGRETRPGAALVLLLGVAAALLAGCATSGPLHVYAVAGATAEEIHDRGAGTSASVSSFLQDEERITGFAYDPFTDHFFLRLEPGNEIKVVDRPARAIKRAFTIEGAPREGGGDLAIRPRDGHVFLLHPRQPVVLETSRLGQLRNTIPLAGLKSPASGLAFDPVNNELLVLHSDGRRVSRHTTDGTERDAVTLGRAAGGSLAYDSARREFYAPLRDEAVTIGVFDASGKLVRTEAATGRFVDVGERSFVRVF